MLFMVNNFRTLFLRPMVMRKTLARNFGTLERRHSLCIRKIKFSHVQASLLSTTSLQERYDNWLHALTDNGFICFIRNSLITVHDVSGIPWGGTILLATLGLRLFVTLPVGVYQSYIIAKLELCKVEFAETIEELKRETAVAIRKFNLTEKQTKAIYNASVKNQWRLLIERENCHPLKSTIVLWAQIPIWIGLSLTLRSMAFHYGPDIDQNDLIATQMATEGFWWFSDLLVADPLHILPTAVMVSNLLIIELQVASKAGQSRGLKILTNVFRCLALLSFPIALTVPSCLSLYWSWSSMLALGQNLLIMSPRFKELCGVPITPTSHDRPYRQAWNNFTSKWSLRR